jgi:O-antigen ligase
MEKVPVLLAISTGMWLLWMCDSKTSMVCLFLGLFVLLGNRLPFFKRSPAFFLSVCFLVIPGGYIIDQIFDLSAAFLDFLGRDPSLTGRTHIWNVLKEYPVNPIFGSGYLMYWDTLGEIMILGSPVTLKTGHNGYLDVYTDGGWLAIAFLVPVIAATGVKIGKNFLNGSDLGKLQLAFFLVFLLANMSESTLFRRGPLWFTFLLCCLDYRRAFPIEEPAGNSGSSPNASAAGEKTVVFGVS